MSLLQKKVLLFYVFAGMLFAFSAPGAVDSAYVCNRTCPTSSSTTVPYPFGFSDGCGIRMNCSELGDIFVDEFRVLKITQDSILVNVPASCNRPIETVLQLYGQNFAPSLRNVFLVANCSHPSLSSCPIKPNLIDALLSLKSCEGTTSNDIKCISDGLKPVSDLVDYAKAHGTDCRVLFSGLGLKQNPSKIGVFELEWWLDGPCICSPNADCVFSSLPRGETGHRCQCNKGFEGDGYPDGLGCIQDRHWIKTIVICVVLGGLLILGLPLALWIKHKRGNFRSLAKAFQDQDDLELPIFNLDTIVKATNNFSPSDMLGEGGFGPVFKGKLELGQEIAVKRLSKSSKQGLKEYMNEVSFIAKLQHRNLVKLLGCCMEGEERLLVYEYMPNKSLDSFIFDRSRADCEALNWARRVHIINGIVRGLVYLHHDSRLRIIHRDLKASNVLLDNELNPKISDFGLAKSFGGNETEGNTNKVVGTHGYMSPEYVTQGHYSIKSDVYSFGVIVLEIISGKRNGGFVPEEGHLDLLGHAWRLYTEGRYSELIDASIGDSCNPCEAQRLIHIGLLCIQYSPEDRPSMSTVALMLGGESKLPRPKQPGFYSKRDLQEAKSSSTSNQDRYSANKVTMTTLEAR